MTPHYYDASSVGPRAATYDVDTKEKLPAVMSIDTASGEVVMAFQPYRVVGDQVDTFTRHYRSIHPIFGGSPKPVLFHCYDLLAEAG